MEYRYTPEALAAAERLGFSGPSADAKLKQMAKLAARFTHPDANYRFRQYIMNITLDGVVTMIDVMAEDEARYYNKRTFDERKAEQDPGEATVEYKRKR